MKGKILLIVLILIAGLVGLEDCRRDPKITGVTATGPDSLYQGTPFSLGSKYLAITVEFPPAQQAAFNSLTQEGVLLGRMLFYDKHLSSDGQKACATCHRTQYGMGDSVTFNITDNGAPDTRNTPPIQNLAWAPYYFWDGRQPTPAAQAGDAIQHELFINYASTIPYLQGDSTYVRLFKKTFGRSWAINANTIDTAIQQFVLSAVSINAPFDQYILYGTGLTPGALDFYTNYFFSESGDCFHCHINNSNYLMTNFSFQNNGLDSATTYTDFRDYGRGKVTGDYNDYGTFRTPSLRNVEFTAPYMHDGRFKTLMQVVNFYSDSLQLSPTVNKFIENHLDRNPDGSHKQTGGLHLDAAHKQEMYEFLLSFSDTTFINNPNLTNPFH